MKSIRILAIALCCALIFSFKVVAEEEINAAFNGFYHVGVGKTSIDSPVNSPIAIDYQGYLITFPIEKDYNYIITVDIQTELVSAWPNNNPELLAIYPTNYALNYITDNYFNQSNSNGVKYSNLINSNTIDITPSGEMEEILRNTITFSTKSGQIDNLNNNTYKFLPLFYIGGTTIGGAYMNNIAIYAVKDNEETKELNDYLNEIISNQNNINDNIIDILSQLSEINDNVINIYNYGNTYNQIEQNIINGLGSAEDQLSNAEDAIQNKSQSLVNKVASQWTANKGVASRFLTTITPATSAIGTVTDNFFDAIPEEIKNAVITIMLIVFIGWLIGRVEG